MEHHKKPDTAILQAFPKYNDKVERMMRTKYKELEPKSERPLINYAVCDIQKFAVLLCQRHRSLPSAKSVCFRELEDYQECMTQEKRKKRAEILQDASKKVGDVIPSLYGSPNDWKY